MLSEDSTQESREKQKPKETQEGILPKAVLLTTLPPSTQCTPKSVLHFETINPRSKPRDDHIYSVHEYRICICPLRSRVTISLHPSPRPNCIPKYAIQKGAGTCCSPLKKRRYFQEGPVE